MSPITRATGGDMEQLRNEVSEMSETLKNAVEDSETRIMNYINVRTEKLEDAMKRYVKAVVFLHIDTIVKTLQVAPPADSAEQQGQPGANTRPIEGDGVITTSSVTSTPETITTGRVTANSATDSQNSNAQTTHGVEKVSDGSNINNDVTNIPGRLRAARTHIRHDVFIGNMSCATTEDEVRAHLMDIGVEHIVSITKVPTPDEWSCAMRVRINDPTILHNVYQNTNFDDGIIIKPFRFFDSDGKLKNNKNASHQTLNRGSNHMRTANHNQISHQTRGSSTRHEYRDNRNAESASSLYNSNQHTQQQQQPSYNSQ